MQDLDTWIAFFTLAALAYYVLPKKVRAGIVDAGRAAIGLLWGVIHRHSPSLTNSTPRPARPAGAARRRGVRSFKARSRVQNGRGARSAHQDAAEPSVQRSAFSVQRSAQAVDRPASMDELQALGEALRLKHSGEERTKQAAIERAFGITKGGGDDWKRASYLYDQAMGAGRAREVETA